MTIVVHIAKSDCSIAMPHALEIIMQTVRYSEILEIYCGDPNVIYHLMAHSHYSNNACCVSLVQSEDYVMFQVSNKARVKS